MNLPVFIPILAVGVIYALLKLKYISTSVVYKFSYYLSIFSLLCLSVPLLVYSDYVSLLLMLMYCAVLIIDLLIFHRALNAFLSCLLWYETVYDYTGPLQPLIACCSMIYMVHCIYFDIFLLRLNTSHTYRLSTNRGIIGRVLHSTN